MTPLVKKRLIKAGLVAGVAACGVFSTDFARAASVEMGASIAFATPVVVAVQSPFSSDSNYNSYVTFNVQVFGVAHQLAFFASTCVVASVCDDRAVLGNSLNQPRLRVLDHAAADGNINITGNDLATGETTVVLRNRPADSSGGQTVEAMLIFL